MHYYSSMVVTESLKIQWWADVFVYVVNSERALGLMLFVEKEGYELDELCSARRDKANIEKVTLCASLRITQLPCTYANKYVSCNPIVLAFLRVIYATPGNSNNLSRAWHFMHTPQGT